MFGCIKAKHGKNINLKKIKQIYFESFCYNVIMYWYLLDSARASIQKFPLTAIVADSVTFSLRDLYKDTKLMI